MSTLVSRADLVYLLAREGQEGLERGAVMARFERSRHKEGKVKPKVSMDFRTEGTAELTVISKKKQSKPKAQYFRVCGYSRVAEEHRRRQKPQFEGVPFTTEELSAPEGVEPPIKTPLMPWARLDPFLRDALGRVRQGAAIDIRRLVRQVAETKPIQKLPRVTRRIWASQAQLLVDRHGRLTPFWDDQSAVYERIRRQRGLAGLEVLVFLDSPKKRRGESIQVFDIKKKCYVPYRPPAEGTPVLLLGECGFIRPDMEVQQEWQALGTQILRRGCRPVALAPCPKDRWPVATSRSWVMAAWDRFERCPVIDDAAFRTSVGGSLLFPDSDDSEEQREDRRIKQQQRAGRLLGLLSAAVRIEPALLRDARRLLRSDLADVGTEADAWVHDSVIVPSPVALGLDPKVAQQERKQLARLSSDKVSNVDSHGLRRPDRLASDLRELLIRHHRHLAPVILQAELFNLSEIWPNQQDLHDFDQYMKRMAATLDKSPTPGRSAYCIRFLEQLPQEGRAKHPELANHWALACQYERSLGTRPLPDGWDAAQIAWAFKASERHYHIWQHGANFVFEKEGWHPGTEDVPQGSLIGGITTSRNFIQLETRPESESVEVIKERNIDLTQAQAVETGQPALLQSEWESLQIDAIRKPKWASAMGRDEFGLYADVSYGDVVQRLRWINPGSFVMGSPEDEPGRHDNERQHRVTLTRGFWLADTPCTQALWQAVMGENPSRFKSPGRPVELVSWHDCNRFLDTLNQQITGLDIRLPREAEWEYTCRAGSSTALYSGPIDIIGESNAPALDPIAWYSGNSGFDFKLDNSYDSSQWKEKQYPHKRAGTHPVKEKLPNPWQLYDMLGNVWEWCHDWYEEYLENAAIDPVGPSNGVLRVLRGGSWIFNVGFVRSACRLRYEPDLRYNFVGFRFARGQ